MLEITPRLYLVGQAMNGLLTAEKFMNVEKDDLYRKSIKIADRMLVEIDMTEPGVEVKEVTEEPERDKYRYD